MHISISLDRSRFEVGESMPGLVTIMNMTGQILEVPSPEVNTNWQPTYTVTGPQYPDGHTFSIRSAVLKDDRSPPPGVDAHTVRLAMGWSHKAQMGFDHLVSLTEPGSYTITARLEWAGMTAVSDPFTFEIVRPSVQSGTLVARPGLQDTGSILVFSMKPRDDAPEVSIGSWLQDMQTDRLEAQSLTRFAAAGADATQLWTPWLNYEGMGTPPPRIGWQAGPVIGVVEYDQSGGTQVKLPFEPVLIRPALMDVSATVRGFVLSSDRMKLASVRFPSDAAESEADKLRRALSGDTAPPAAAPSLEWTFDLPEAAVMARAALGPSEKGNTAYAVLVAERPGGAAFHLATAASGPKPVSLRTAAIPGWRPLATSEPALRVAEDGAVHTSVILERVSEKPDPHALGMVDVHWPASGADPKIDVTALVTLDIAPMAALVTYTLTPAAHPRRDGLILTAPNVGRFTTEPSRTHRFQGTPVLPLELLALGEFTYVLVTTASGALGFERL